MENTSLEAILDQNKELISKVDNSTRKVWKNLSVANQRITKEVKRGKLSLVANASRDYNSHRNRKRKKKEEKSTKLNVRNFNTDGMEKTQNEIFKNESN